MFLNRQLHGVPKIIDPVFAKTSPKRSFCMVEIVRFGLVFENTGSINSDTADDSGLRPLLE
jgi:hypothetical protein